jgi:hypothetical protein
MQLVQQLSPAGDLMLRTPLDWVKRRRCLHGWT